MMLKINVYCETESDKETTMQIIMWIIGIVASIFLGRRAGGSSFGGGGGGGSFGGGQQQPPSRGGSSFGGLFGGGSTDRGSGSLNPNEWFDGGRGSSSGSSPKQGGFGSSRAPKAPSVTPRSGGFKGGAPKSSFGKSSSIAPGRGKR